SLAHIKLEETMAGTQRHMFQITDVPGIDNHPAAIRLIPDQIDGFCQLIDHPSIRSPPGSPLLSIYGAQITIFVCPFVPYPYAMFLKIFHIGIAFYKPYKFIDYGFEM